MRTTTLLVAFACTTLGCSPGKTCPDGQVLSATGDCEDRQEGGSSAPEGGLDTDGGDTAGGDDTGGGVDTGPRGEMSASVVWDGTGVVLTADGGRGDDGYYFGMAETGVDGGWTGEDCYYGSGDYFICHYFMGDRLALQTVGSPEDVVASVTTLFGASDDRAITYCLRNLTTYTCVSWGDDPSYFSSYGCEEL